MKKRVVVAMSGGVDSSLAACLLKQRGFEVVGITMCFNLAGGSGRKPSCCGIQGIEDARRVAHQLNIRHYVLNMQKALQEKVIKDFCREYAQGRTPNPCVRCNQFIKFDYLFKEALSLDAAFLATGHYARVVKDRYYWLAQAKDKHKDQSYFLYRLGQAQLKHILFPVGDYTKDRVRALARKSGLYVADKPASQEICFLPGSDYRAFLQERLKKELKPGIITDRNGEALGRHKGIAYYTIGQREGLGIARGYPLYINKIDASNNQITVGKREDCLSREFLVREASFIAKPLKKAVVLNVKIRYNHKGAQAEVVPLGDKIKIRFKQAQFAVTPGQSAVFYDQKRVLGGGIIERVLDEKRGL